ncbi:MAG: tripartite tricarboxylate transporter substrate binding protein, partial [Verrucomicrobiota bacterium]
ARIVQEGIRRESLSSEPLVIINVPGLGGSIGSRRAKAARPDGYTILNLHDGIFTATYSGTVDYGTEAFVPIASTGSAHTVVAMGAGAPWKSLAEVLAKAKAEPGGLLYGGNLGAPSEFVGRLLQSLEEGAAFKMIPLGGGAERYTKLAGGHIDFSIFSVSEFKEFQWSDENPQGLRGLVYLGPERHADLPTIPTAREQGYDLVTGTTQYWWAPKGTPTERVSWLSQLLEGAMASEWVREKYEELGMERVAMTGEELDAHLKRAEESIASVGSLPSELPRPLPVVPLALGAVIGCGVAFGIRARRKRERMVEGSGPREGGTVQRMMGMFVLLVGYVLLLQWGVVGYVWCTFLFLAVTGWLLASARRQQITAVGLAAGVAVLFAWVFQSLLVLDLP